MSVFASIFTAPLFDVQSVRDAEGQLVDALVPAVGAVVTIKRHGEGSPAPLYASRLMEASLDNPLPSGVVPGQPGLDTSGNILFWAEAGDEDGSHVYEMTVTYAGVTTGPFVVLPSSPDAAEPPAAGSVTLATLAPGFALPAANVAPDVATTAALTAEALLARNADNLTSGTVADARVASTIARDSEVTAAVAAEATLARNADNLTSGTVADARVASTIARDSEVAAAITASEAGQVRDGDAAGGVLAGTFPSPVFAADMATQVELDAEAALARSASNLSSGTVPLARITNLTDAQVAAVNKDGAAGTASMRTLGTGAQQAAPGSALATEITDRSAADTAHAAAADPHPGYLTPAEGNATFAQVPTPGVQTTAIVREMVTAKGDIIAASASGAVVRVAVGANSQYLQADSSAASGVSWADLPAAGGSISGQLTASSSSQHSITGNNTGNALNLRNLNAAGYPATLLQDNAGTAVGVYGYGNGSVAVTTLRLSMFFASLVASTTVPGAVRVGQWLNNGVDFRTRLLFDTDGTWSLYKLDGTSKVLTYDPTAGYVVLTGTVTGKNAGQVRNTHVSGYSVLEFLDSTGAATGYLGSANGSATFAPGVVYFGTNSADNNPREYRLTQFLSNGASNKTRLKLTTTGDMELYHSDGTTKLVSLVSVAPVAGSVGDLTARPCVSLGAIMALSGWNRAANGTAHIIQANNNIENTLAVQSISTGNETYSSIALLDEAGDAKFTFGFGNKSSLVWKRRAYLEAWCGQHSVNEVPDIITVQSSGFPNLSFVRMRHIGCAPGGSPGDTVFYRSVAWPTDVEPANSRAMTIYTDGSGVELNKVAAGYIAASPDGTRYKLTPSNGGGAASWVAA